MYYKDDWLMWETSAFFSAMPRILFKSDEIWYGWRGITEKETDLVHEKLIELIRQKKICEAEDYLYDNFKDGSKVWLILAFDFYQRLNEFSDGELEDNNFSREEVLSGIKDLVSRSGFDIDISIDEDQMNEQ